MISTLSTALLTIGSIAAAPDDPLRTVIPDDAFYVIELGDLASRIERASDATEGWDAVFADRRFADLVRLADAPLGFDGIDGLDSSIALLEIARFVEGGVLSVRGDTLTSGNQSLMLEGALRLRDGYREAWSALARTAGLRVTETGIIGHPALVVDWNDEIGVALVLVDVGDVTLVSINDELGGPAVLAELESALATEPTTPDWMSSIAGKPDGALIEAYMRLEGGMAQDPVMDMFASAAECIYVGAALGEGSSMDLVFGGKLRAHEAADAFAGAVRTADPRVLARVPSGASGTGALSVDVAALIDAVTLFTESVAPDDDTRLRIDQAFEAFSQVVGLDVEDDLIANLTGDFVFAQWIESFEQIADIEEQESFDDFADAVPLFAFGVEDPEPFLTLVETGLGLILAAGIEASVEEHDVGSELIVTIPDSSDVRAHVLVTDDWVTLGLDGTRVLEFARGTGESEFSSDELAEIGRHVGGFGVALARTERALAFVQEGFAGETAEQDLGEVPAEVIGLFEALADHLDGVTIGEYQLGPRWCGFRLAYR